MQHGHAAEQALENEAGRAPNFLKDDRDFYRARRARGSRRGLEAPARLLAADPHGAEALSALHVDGVGRQFRQRDRLLVFRALLLGLLQDLRDRQLRRFFWDMAIFNLVDLFALHEKRSKRKPCLRNILSNMVNEVILYFHLVDK